MGPTDLDIATLERSTLDAVAPPRVAEIDGWLLPLEKTTIGRAKSAVPLRHHAIDGQDVARIEATYAQHGLPAQFRVADVVGLENIHAVLRQQGYQAEQSTLVQVGSAMHMRDLASSSGLILQTQPTPAWADVYTAKGFDPVDGAHRVAALSRGKNAVYAHIRDGGTPVAAGVGSFSHGWASIHGMRTVHSHRGKGLARSVLAAIAREAQTRGLDRIFLQVEDGNAAALTLYRRAGFSTAWRYYYWRKPGENEPTGQGC